MNVIIEYSNFASLYKFYYLFLGTQTLSGGRRQVDRRALRSRRGGVCLGARRQQTGGEQPPRSGGVWQGVCPHHRPPEQAWRACP